MNVQRCRFLLLPEWRPALRIRSRWSGSSGRSAKRRIDALGVDRAPDGVACRLGHDPAAGVPGVATVSDGRVTLVFGCWPRRAGWRRAGRPGRASADRLASPRRRRTGPRRRGCALACGRRGDVAPPWPDPAVRPWPGSGTRRPLAGSPGPRTATSAGRRPRRASRPRPRTGRRPVPAGRPRPAGPGARPARPCPRCRGRAGPARRSGRWPRSR